MNFTAIILLATCLAASAHGYGQKVTLSEKNASLEKIFSSIRKQTGYDFLYTDEMLRNTQPVTIELRRVDLDDALTLLFISQPLHFRIIETTIVIQPKVQLSINEILPATIDVKGRVVDEDGKPIEGASVQVKEDKLKGTSTDAGGYFSLADVDEASTIVISGVNVELREVKLQGKSVLGDVVMKRKVGEGENIVVEVNTGFQRLPKERATGSFDHVNNELFNRQVSTDVLSRLDGIASSVMFDNRPNSNRDVSIRGLSTIFSDRKPLIVLNNFPYEGNINDINPNDIEDITILKDATAASIWGARAGNGVIVIVTKKPKRNQPAIISFNNNISLVEKPDMRQLATMSPSDYIEAERMIFNNNYYDATEQLGYLRLTPAVEMMYKHKRGLISDAELEQGLSDLGQHDIRNEMNKYLYRQGINQQYSLNVSGQNENINYYLSGGYDNNTGNTNGGYKRYSLRSDNTLRLSKRLSLNGAVFFTHTINKAGMQNDFGTLYPYARFADDNGNSLPVDRYFRSGYLQEAKQNGLLDWEYRPLDEISLVNNVQKTYSTLINAGLNYNVAKGFDAEVKYQLENLQGYTKDLRNAATYYTRNEINRYTQIDGNGDIFRPIPLGDILYETMRNLTAQSLRLQLNYSGSWGRHELRGIAGAEARQSTTTSSRSTQYGYNPNLLTSAAINHDVDYRLYSPTGGSSKIPNPFSSSELNDRFISVFTNWAYTFNNRYNLNLSARQDGSNLFGVKSNQKFTPLWSVGASWNITSESFVNITWLDVLKLRATFGYSGNLNRNVSALPTIRYENGGNLIGTPYAVAVNPPNENLRWEKNGQFNLGIDFSVFKHRLTGSVEYYRKNNTDLIGYMPLDQTTGAINPVSSRGFSFLGNSASMVGNGVDVQLTSINIRNAFEWRTDFLYSLAKSRVTEYFAETRNINDYITAGMVISPIIGRPVFSISTLPWAGLDPQTGEPMGYLKGEVSKNYAAIRSQTTPEELVYFGSALPTQFGSLRNTFTYKGLSFSFNISYKLGFYFKRNSIFYSAIYSGAGAHSDFGLRWQKPGDELTTQVPALIYPLNANRDGYFYSYSAALISKGDNIRLQDINLTYQIKSLENKWKLKRLEAMMYVTNLGIIWKADKHHVDPEFGDLAPLKTISFGLRAGF